MKGLTTAQIEKAQEQFVEVKPDIERMAGHAFKSFDPDAREEAVAVTIAFCWRNYLHCVAEGKHVGASSLAYYALLAVKNGRSFAGQSSEDVMSPRTQMLGRANVVSLSAPATTPKAEGGWGRDYSAILADRRVWEQPLERVRLKHDYAAFLNLREVTPQEQQVFALLAEGYRTAENSSAFQGLPTQGVPDQKQHRHEAGELHGP